MSGNDMAFPVMDRTQTPNETTQLGLTKREYFSLHLMCALRSQVHPESGDDCYTRVSAAKAAIGDADTLLAELEKPR